MGMLSWTRAGIGMTICVLVLVVTVAFGGSFGVGGTDGVGSGGAVGGGCGNSDGAGIIGGSTL